MARILIAVSDAAERRTVAAGYRLTGSQVTEVGDAVSCLEVLERETPDALVIDPRLPGLDGSGLLRHVRRNPGLASMKVSLLAHDMDAALWEFLGRQFFDVVVEESGAEAAGTLASGGRPSRKGPKSRAAAKTEAPEDLHRIVVVEDEPTYAILLGTEFRNHGWETLSAESAEAGLELLGRERVDAVLSDINLPGMPGNEFAFEVRASHPEVKVVLMTGMPRERYPGVPGDVPILPKPISVRELMAAMRFMKQG